MPVEPLWRWLRGELANRYLDDLGEQVEAVEAFEAQINAFPLRVADRLVVVTELDHEAERLRFSNVA